MTFGAFHLGAVCRRERLQRRGIAANLPGGAVGHSGSLGAALSVTGSLNDLARLAAVPRGYPIKEQETRYGSPCADQEEIGPAEPHLLHDESCDYARDAAR